MLKKKFILFDIDHTLFDTERFKTSNLETYSIYSEVLEILDKLAKVATLGIFSQGELNFQKTKLKNTRIEGFFKEKHVHIFAKKELGLADVLNSYRNYKIFLVDDQLDVLRLAKKIMPSISTIWIKRGPHAKKQKKIKGFSPDNTVFDLQQIGNIVNYAKS